ncbi:FtsX-like permease family protein [bacterium]|nr:FtsX-like permease family protein [bacterium]NBX98237.1 FtsX-like permease family protein [bacterium]NDC94645.1 FtsX-like permease family protein [bacterium]NDD84267.1 FtsX-like permease family protein [bacterium]NDG29915.1 FtsX-like permease family protein [bacterium]
MSMTKEHIKMAFATMSQSRTRSFMTMLGIIISVAAVITIVGLGHGLRNQVSGQIGKLGSNLILVQPGQTATSSVDLTSLQSLASQRGTLTEQDYTSITKLPGIKQISPVATISGLPRFENKTMERASIVGSNDKLPDIIGKEIEYGSFFGPNDTNKNHAVIGRGVASELFGENVPIGKSFSIRNSEFIVTGVFTQSPVTPLSPSINFNNAIVIPYNKAKEIGGASLQFIQILVVAESAETSQALANNIQNTIKANHGGQQDFSVLQQEEALAISDGVFSQLTMFITGAAIIALIVGGIGVMNIMFASVSERTREIGIRKAVGATNKQIINQFMTEAIIITFSGGILGILLASVTILTIRVTTSLQPAFVLPIMALALAVTTAIGLASGILPALKAAKKDPIESLR